MSQITGTVSYMKRLGEQLSTQNLNKFSSLGYFSFNPFHGTVNGNYAHLL